MLSTPLARASLRASRRELPVLSRPFSSTPAHNAKAKGPVPVFPDPEVFTTPELTDIISKLKYELIIPSHLAHRYRHLMYSKPLHKYLRGEEAYTMRVKGQDWTLTPREKQESFGGVKALTQALNLMQTPEEFDAVPAILLAWHQADRARELGIKRYELVARKLRNAGQFKVLGRLINEAEEIGFRMSRLGARWMALAFWEEVQEAKPKVKNSGFRRMLRLKVALKEWEGGKVLVESGLAEDPVICGILLGVRAKHCLNLHEGADKDGHVSKFADEFLSTMTKDPAEDKLPEYSVGKAFHDITVAEEWQAVMDGVRLAQEVLKPTEPEKVDKLEKEAARIEAAIDKWAS